MKLFSVPNASTVASNPRLLFLWSAVASFSTYFCMYGFRKPLTAATFEHLHYFGISLKSALVIAQVFGYMTAKFVGIKFISEVAPSARGKYILVLIGIAHLSLLLLALVPPPFNISFLFLNGLCLGLIWGLVFGFIEGRKFTDALALILSTNFIFSSGIAKSLGRVCIEDWHIPEIWMPFVAGLLYIPFLLLSVWMLNRIPPQSESEIESRGERISLSGRERRSLLFQFAVGLVAITIINLVCTVLRDVKDNFAVEILRVVKPNFDPSIFARMETFAAFAVLGLLLLMAGIKNHLRSLLFHHIAIATGMSGLMFCAYLLQNSLFNPVWVLILYTISLYVCYNTLQCLFLDRFMATFKVKGNIGFFFYFMDSIGYLGSCFVILLKEVFRPHQDWMNFFLRVSYILGITGLLCTIISLIYFSLKYKTQHPAANVRFNEHPAL